MSHEAGLRKVVTESRPGLPDQTSRRLHALEHSWVKHHWMPPLPRHTPRSRSKKKQNAKFRTKKRHPLLPPASSTDEKLHNIFIVKICLKRTSLMVQWFQWLGIHLPMQTTWVRSLVQEDPTCLRAAKPTCHNYWSPGTWSLCSATRETTARSPHIAMNSSSCSP